MYAAAERNPSSINSAAFPTKDETDAVTSARLPLPLVCTPRSRLPMPPRKKAAPKKKPNSPHADFRGLAVRVSDLIAAGKAYLALEQHSGRSTSSSTTPAWERLPSGARPSREAPRRLSSGFRRRCGIIGALVNSAVVEVRRGLQEELHCERCEREAVECEQDKMMNAQYSDDYDAENDDEYKTEYDDMWLELEARERIGTKRRPSQEDKVWEPCWIDHTDPCGVDNCMFSFRLNGDDEGNPAWNVWASQEVRTKGGGVGRLASRVLYKRLISLCSDTVGH